MKKGNIDDALRILGFDINDNGDYVYQTKETEDDDKAEYIEEVTGSDDDQDEKNEEADEDIEMVTDIPDVLSPATITINGDVSEVPIIMPGDEKELTLEEAIDFIKEMLTKDTSSILDVNNNAKLSECLIMIADKVNDITYKSNPDYIGKVRALETKIENYKKEFNKAKTLEKKLYLIASAEERFYKHFLEFGYEDIVARDISKAMSSWQDFIYEETDINLNEVRDIGEILFKLKERTINNGKK